MKKLKNKKWQKPRRFYKGRFFYIKRTLQITSYLLVIALVMGTVYYLENSDTLFVKKVSVLGDKGYLTKEDVIKLSGIQNNDKLFKIDLEEVSKKILRHPWVDSVSMRREFPDTIQIHLEERKPVAILRLKNFYLVDQNGIVFKKMKKKDFSDVPVITGFEELFAEKYPLVSKKYLKETLDFLNFLKGFSFYQRFEISEIHFDPVFGFTVFPLKIPLEIYYGKKDWQTKQNKFEKFVSSKTFLRENFVRLDLNTPQKIIARRNTSK